MNLNQPLLNELKHEATNTRKILESVPAEHLGWKPHPKSMTLGRLASHVAELSDWLTYTINADELDLASLDYTPTELTDTQTLFKIFDESLARGTAALQNASDETLMSNWTLRTGDHVMFTLPKIVVVRNMVLNHIVHHRGQLSVFLRLLDVPVPGMYGPSYDEENSNA